MTDGGAPAARDSMARRRAAPKEFTTDVMLIVLSETPSVAASVSTKAARSAAPKVREVYPVTWNAAATANPAAAPELAGVGGSGTPGAGASGHGELGGGGNTSAGLGGGSTLALEVGGDCGGEPMRGTGFGGGGLCGDGGDCNGGGVGEDGLDGSG